MARGDLSGVSEGVLFALVRAFQLNEAETAQVLACPRGSVKSRTARGLARLRANLGEEARRG